MKELQVHVREMGLKLFGAEHPPHADINGKPCVDVLGSRVAEGGGEVGGQVMEACLKPLGDKPVITIIFQYSPSHRQSRRRCPSHLIRA